jgi:hypothetical protein
VHTGQWPGCRIGNTKQKTEEIVQVGFLFGSLWFQWMSANLGVSVEYFPSVDQFSSVDHFF